MSKMGQILSVCTTHPSSIDDATHGYLCDDQLPPIGSLYVPSNNGLHKFLYDQVEGDNISFHMSQIGHKIDTQNRARTSIFTKDALKLHRPASRYSKSISPSCEYDGIEHSSSLADAEVESDQESVMTTVSPCKDRSIRTNNRNKNGLPSLQLRLPVQRSLTSITPTIPSRPSIHRFSSTSKMIVEEVGNDKKLLMWEALQQGDIVEVEKLLLTVSAVDVYCWNWPESHGDMILHLAVRLASPLPLLQLLLRYDIGGGPVTPNSDGDTPISLAGKLRHFELLACLMQALQAPYYKSPVSPLRLSTYTYENSPDYQASSASSIINMHQLRSSMSSLSSSLHLSILFDSDNEQEIATDAIVDNHQLKNNIPLDSVIQELLEEIIEDIISSACATVIDSSPDDAHPSHDEAFLPPFQQSSPCISHMSHGVQAKHAPGRSRSSSLVSESDEWCVRGSTMDNSDEEVYMHRYSAPPPSLSLSSQSYKSSTMSYKDKDSSLSDPVVTTVNNSTSKVPGETAISCNFPAKTQAIQIAVELQHDVENNDDLFCCSPFLSSSKKGISSTTISTSISRFFSSPSNNLQPAVAVSSLSVQQPVVSMIPPLTTDICKEEDYGLFVELDGSNQTVSPVTTATADAKSTPCKENHLSGSEGSGTSEGESVATAMRRRFVPRPLRKATGRLVRFMLPTFHKHK